MASDEETWNPSTACSFKSMSQHPLCLAKPRYRLQVLFCSCSKHAIASLMSVHNNGISVNIICILICINMLFCTLQHLFILLNQPCATKQQKVWATSTGQIFLQTLEILLGGSRCSTKLQGLLSGDWEIRGKPVGVDSLSSWFTGKKCIPARWLALGFWWSVNRFRPLRFLDAIMMIATIGVQAFVRLKRRD